MTKRTRTIILQGSGMEVTFAMPNLYQLLASHVKLPNPMTGRIIQLLEDVGLYGKSTQEQVAAYNRDTLMGAMELASICLVKPKLVLDREPGEGEVGPEAFAHSDWGELLALFRSDPPRPANPGNKPEAATPPMGHEPANEGAAIGASPN